MNLLRFFGFRTSKRKKVFVSYSSMEELLAKHLGAWLKEKLNMDCFCGALPEAIGAGTDWYERITEAASGSDECLLLLGPDSLLKGWIHFEAGVALGASIQKTSSSQLTLEELKEKKKNIVASCVGIGSDGYRQVLQNPQGDRRWRLDDANWTTAIIAGWADGSNYRVDLDHAEIDWAAE